MYVFRPISNLIVSRIYLIKSITPNLVTLLSFLCILIAFILFMSRSGVIIGCLFIFLHYLLDCVDGDLAKAQFKCTRFGDWMDGVIDRIGDFLTFVAIGYMLNTMLGWKLVLVIISSIFLTVLASMSIKNPLELVGTGKEQVVNSAKNIVGNNPLFKIIGKLGFVPTDFLFGKGVRTLLIIMGLLSGKLLLLLYLIALCQMIFLIVTAMLIWGILKNEK